MGYVQPAGRDNWNFVVVYKERFVHYHFFEGNMVLKVTTNHIERSWVEMRKHLRGVRRDEIHRRIYEVPYRLWQLSTGNRDQDFNNLVHDLVRFNEDQKIREIPSAFKPSNAGEVV